MPTYVCVQYEGLKDILVREAVKGQCYYYLAKLYPLLESSKTQKKCVFILISLFFHKKEKSVKNNYILKK